MSFNKRILIKPLIILVIALGVLAVSLYKNKKAVDDSPEIVAVQTAVAEQKISSSDLLRAYSKAESSLMRKKEYDKIHRLTELIRKSGKASKELSNIMDFSEYSAYFFAGKYPEALAKLEKIDSNPATIPEVKGAIAGEKMRCIAATKGIDAAIVFFNSFIKDPKTLPAMLPYVYNTCINVLFQFGKNEDALKRTAEAATVIADKESARQFLERLGRFLVREQNPDAKLHSLMPTIDIRNFCVIMNSMADEYIAILQYGKAEESLNKILKNKYVPQDLKNMANIKLTICKEKKAAEEKNKVQTKKQ